MSGTKRLSREEWRTLELTAFSTSSSKQTLACVLHAAQAHKPTHFSILAHASFEKGICFSPGFRGSSGLREVSGDRSLSGCAKDRWKWNVCRADYPGAELAALGQRSCRAEPQRAPPVLYLCGACGYAQGFRRTQRPGAPTLYGRSDERRCVCVYEP
jgi:hypothetical protein